MDLHSVHFGKVVAISIFGVLIMASVGRGDAFSTPMPVLSRTIAGSNYDFIDYSYYDEHSANGYFNLPARLYVPPNLDPNVSHPLVTFLHGAGEWGTNNSAPVNATIDNLIVNAKKFGFLVYIPQSPQQYWSNDQAFMSQNLIARAVNQYHVDPNRLYATGLSLGGGALLPILGQYPKQYAAYIPLSQASSITDDQATKAVGKPMWFFHARQDPVVSVYSSESAVAAIAAKSGYVGPSFPASNSQSNYQYDSGTLHYTETAAGGHDSNFWSGVAYNTAALYPWMLAQKTTQTTLQDGCSISMNFVTPATDELKNEVTADSTGRKWNTVGRSGMEATADIAVGFARDTTGTPTTNSIGLTKAFTNTGTNVPGGITAFADAASVGEFWKITAGSQAEFKFYNLTPGGLYNLSLFASTTDSFANTRFTVGSAFATLNANNNLSQFATLANLQADATGTLTLDIAGVNGSNSGYLNTLTLTSVPEPTTAMLAAGGMLLLGRRRGQR